MGNGTITGNGSQRPNTLRKISKGLVLASAVVSVLAGCSSGSSTTKSAPAGAPGANGNPSKPASSASGPAAPPTSPNAPSPPAAPSTPSARAGHTPVAPGSPAGPATELPGYADAAPVGPEPQWKAVGGGVEVSGGAAGFAARFDPATVRFTLHAGTQVPGGSGWPGGNTAPTSGLVAGWNGGFLMANGASWGGFQLDGRIAYGPLRTNTASEVFYKDGSMDVLAWPGGQAGPDVAGVRQNLVLLIDGGRLATNLARGTSADEHAWGFTNDSSNVHANRSGVGVTADGKVVYAAVRGASPLQLAQFLQRAGAVRAMQLDINMSRPIFGTFGDGRWSQPAPWLGAASQFTLGNLRDFVVVYAR